MQLPGLRTQNIWFIRSGQGPEDYNLYLNPRWTIDQTNLQGIWPQSEILHLGGRGWEPEYLQGSCGHLEQVII